MVQTCSAQKRTIYQDGTFVFIRRVLLTGLSPCLHTKWLTKTAGCIICSCPQREDLKNVNDEVERNMAEPASPVLPIVSMMFFLQQIMKAISFMKPGTKCNLTSTSPYPMQTCSSTPTYSSTLLALKTPPVERNLKSAARIMASLRLLKT